MELCIHITRVDNGDLYIVAIVDNEDAGRVGSIPPHLGAVGIYIYISC